MQIQGGSRGPANLAVFAPTVDKTEILYGMVHDSLINQRRFKQSSIKRATWAPGNRVIETTWGTTLRAISLDSESPAEGLGIIFAVVDEAQRIEEKVWQSSVRPTLSDTGGRSLFVGKAVGSYFRKLSENATRHPGTWGAHRFPTWANPIIDPAEIEEARQEMPAWYFDQEYGAIFQDQGTRVFTGAEACATGEPIPIPKADGRVYVHGWDLARKMDETVGYTLDCTEKPYQVVCAHYSRRLPWPATQDAILRQWQAYGGDVVIDGTGIGDVVLGNLGIPTSRLKPDEKGYVFTTASKWKLITGLQAAIEHKWIRFPREPVLLRQLDDYEYDDDALETDRVMALGLAVYGASTRGSAGILVL